MVAPMTRTSSAGSPSVSSSSPPGVGARLTALDGPRLVALAAAVLAVEAAATLATGPLTASLGELLRVTARTSLAWFLLAFVARPLVVVAPSPASKWLLRNRRYLGLGLAVSHAGHLAAIVAFAAVAPTAFWADREVGTLLGGGLAYALLAAMAATSTDRAAAWLGRRRWRALHTAGMWTLWAVFAVSYGGRAGVSVLAAVLAALIACAAALRALALVRTRRRGPRRAAA